MASAPAFWLACGFCGVLTDRVEWADALAHLGAAMGTERFRLDRTPPTASTSTRCAPRHALRRGATFRGCRAARGTGPSACRPCAEADLDDLDENGADPIAIGLMCRAGEWGAALEMLRAHRAMGVANRDPCRRRGAGLTPEPGILVARRPMAGDFAAQRNALQDLSPAPWMLQLDTDETLAPGTAALLPALARLAEAGGAVSIGLPRAISSTAGSPTSFPTRSTGSTGARSAMPAASTSGRTGHGSAASSRCTGDRPPSVPRAGRDPFAHLRGDGARRGRLEEEDALLQPFRD